MNKLFKALTIAGLTLAAAQAFAAECSPTVPFSDCSSPPAGAILDLAGTPVPTAYQLYTVSFVASMASTNLTFAFRSDPEFIRLDDVTLTAANGPNLIVNGDFEGSTYLGFNGYDQPAGWVYHDPQVDNGDGQVVNRDTPHGGVANYSDGIVGGYDFLSQAVPTVVGTQYTLSFYAFNPSGGTFSQTGVGGTEGDMGPRALDILVYADAQPAIAAVPEPGSIALLGLGVAGLALARRRKRH